MNEWMVRASLCPVKLPIVLDENEDTPDQIPEMIVDCWVMAPEKSWCLVECPARWEPQEEGMMNIAARFSLS
jgi:hypothetical protein